MEHHSPPSALLRGAATVLPRALLAPLVDAVVRRLGRSHPKLMASLSQLESGTVYIAPIDLPYGFALTIGGGQDARLQIVEAAPLQASASLSGSVAALLDLLEGRIDGDTLFFRRDLLVSGNAAVVVGLRNVLDREELRITDELGALCGPLRPAARRVAVAAERAMRRFEARVAVVHRSLHPEAARPAPDLAAELERSQDAIAALTARLAALEARQKRRDDRAA